MSDVLSKEESLKRIEMQIKLHEKQLAYELADVRQKLLDKFAMAAMSGHADNIDGHECIAKWSYELAEAMMAERDMRIARSEYE